MRPSRYLILALVLISLNKPAIAQEDGSTYASLAPQQVLIQQNALPLRPTGPLSEIKISLDLRDIEIIDALKFLATKAGMNIIPTKKVAGRITLMVDNTAAKDVFDIILRSNNLAYEKRGDIYNVMTDEEYKSLFGTKFSDTREVRIVRLKYMVPDQAFNFIDSLKSEIGKILLDAESGTLLIMDTPTKIKEIEEALASMEEKGAVQVFSLKYALAKNVEEQLNKQLDVKKLGSIKADERTNQVIVHTLADRMGEIAKLIEGLDKKTKEILIDARIIQIKLTRDLSEGVQWEGLFNLGKKYGMSYLGSYPFSSVALPGDEWRSRQQVLQDTGYVGSYPFSGTTSEFSASTKTISTENMHLGVVGRQDFDVLMQYFQSLGETKILSNPKLAVINNHEAKIHVGERQAYITTTVTQGQGPTTTSEQVTFLDVGLQLVVTPFINDEGFVTIKIKPEISSVIDYLETSVGNKIPIIDTSSAETMVMVKDGTTLIVGGLSKNQETKDNKQTPFLGKVPILGDLFKTKTSGNVRTELLIMLTPHILSGDELSTGYVRDFDYSLDKDRQGYAAFTEEGPQAEYKHFQAYPKANDKKAEQPTIKPMQEIK